MPRGRVSGGRGGFVVVGRRSLKPWKDSLVADERSEPYYFLGYWMSAADEISSNRSHQSSNRIGRIGPA